MKTNKAATDPPSEESTKFTDGVKRLVSIPKEEMDRREAEWRKERLDKKVPKETE